MIVALLNMLTIYTYEVSSWCILLIDYMHSSEASEENFLFLEQYVVTGPARC